MKRQDIVFLCEDDVEAGAFSKEFFAQIRLYIYQLRNYVFKNNIDAKIAFFKINKNEKDSEYLIDKEKFFNFDEFSISKNNQDSLFINTDWKAVKKYLFNIPEVSDEEKSPRIVLFKAHNISKDFTSDSELFLLYKMKKPDITTVVLDQIKEKSNVSNKNIKEIQINPVISKKIVIGLLCSFAAICLISLSPIIVNTIKKMMIVYEKVYTGDGDRLIMRSNPQLESEELIRLHEGECVQLVEKGSEWDKVNYHGIIGYCHNDYFIKAEKDEYSIENPEAVFSYGLACMKYIDSSDIDGISWIRNAANKGLLRAQWEMAKCESSYELRINWLNKIYINDHCLEDDEVSEWKYASDVYKDNGDKELSVKFRNKAKERENDIKIIRQQAALQLSYSEIEKNCDVASDFYLRALDLGIKPDSQYMYKLAQKFIGQSNEAKFKQWMSKASENNMGKATYELAQHIEKTSGMTSEAMSYYRTSYMQGYFKEVCADKCLEYANIHGDANNFVYWASRISELRTYSDIYYKSQYYLGLCYENGIGTCWKNITYAKQYYRNAYYNLKEAREAYDRLNKKSGGNY